MRLKRTKLTTKHLRNPTASCTLETSVSLQKKMVRSHCKSEPATLQLHLLQHPLFQITSWYQKTVRRGRILSYYHICHHQEKIGPPHPDQDPHLPAHPPDSQAEPSKNSYCHHEARCLLFAHNYIPTIRKWKSKSERLHTPQQPLSWQFQRICLHLSLQRSWSNLSAEILLRLNSFLGLFRCCTFRIHQVWSEWLPFVDLWNSHCRTWYNFPEIQW